MITRKVCARFNRWWIVVAGCASFFCSRGNSWAYIFIYATHIIRIDLLYIDQYTIWGAPVINEKGGHQCLCKRRARIIIESDQCISVIETNRGRAAFWSVRRRFLCSLTLYMHSFGACGPLRACVMWYATLLWRCCCWLIGSCWPCAQYSIMYIYDHLSGMARMCYFSLVERLTQKRIINYRMCLYVCEWQI